MKYFGLTAFYYLGQISADRNIWPWKGGWSY